MIISELNLSGSRIDKINLYDRFSLYLETYGSQGKQKVIISLTNGALRLNRTETRPPFPDYPPRFAQLLRSRIKGGRILSVSQPEGQRIVQFSIKYSDEIFYLWCRFWGGNPNMILTDVNYKIIDTLIRKKESRELAGQIYKPDFSSLKSTNNKQREIRVFPSRIDFNAFIDSYYREKTTSCDFDKIKNKKIKNLELNISRIKFHISKLENRQKHFSQWPIYREYGEIIQANLYKMKKGDPFVTTENFFHNNEIIKIKLEPKLSPLENSERFFTKYKKSREGLTLVEDEILSFQKNLQTVEALKNEIEEADTLEVLNQLTSDEKKRAPVKKSHIGLEFNSDGYSILVGRNSKENDQLLRSKARGNDMWLHVRDFPGGFVMIKIIKGKSIPLDVLLDGANLALLYSSKKTKDKADIHYTEVKNLRRVKGGKEGQVLANNEKNLFISYDEQRINRLQHKDKLLETKVPKKDN